MSGPSVQFLIKSFRVHSRHTREPPEVHKVDCVHLNRFFQGGLLICVFAYNTFNTESILFMDREAHGHIYSTGRGKPANWRREMITAFELKTGIELILLNRRKDPKKRSS